MMKLKYKNHFVCPMLLSANCAAISLIYNVHGSKS